MEQVARFRSALSLALAKQATNKASRLPQYLTDNPERVRSIISFVSGLVLQAVRAGAASTRIELSTKYEEDVASEFLRAAGLNFAFEPRSCSDPAAGPGGNGQVLVVTISTPIGN